MRLRWIEMHERLKNAGIVCRRCGISRPTLRKWLKRYQLEGIEGLKAHSKRPHCCPTLKITEQIQARIMEIRKERNIGVRRIQSELKRLFDFKLSMASIHKVLRRNNASALRHVRRIAHKKRYERPIPGDRIQMDVIQIGSGLYQYTAIDDCTRHRVLRLYSRKTAANTLDFIEQVMEDLPFPIQRIQTDRDRVFFAYKVQEAMMEWRIKFRPIRPRSPQLNGKVERSQKTDLEEFYATVDLTRNDLSALLDEWQHYYNWQRPHGALKGKTPMDRYLELAEQTPLAEDVLALYDPIKEDYRDPHYAFDERARKLKRSL